MEIRISLGNYQSNDNQKELNSSKKMQYSKSTDFVEDYIVFDFETTGFNCYNDEIIEIGAIKYKNFEEIDRFTSLINPNDIVSPYILELTGIEQSTLDNAPGLENVINDFVDFIDDFPLIAHNASFDMRFLLYSLIKTNTEYRVFTSINTLTLARRYIDETKNHKLKTLKKFMNMDKMDSHRSIDDCIVTNELYKICYSRKDDPKYITRVPSKKGIDLNELKADSIESIDVDHPLFDVNICFTGALNDLTRKEMGQLLVNIGAVPQNGVTAKTQILVLGEQSYLDYINNDKRSSKLNKAIKNRDDGKDIQIISEGDFLNILQTYES